MPKPLPPTLTGLHLADWGETLIVDLTPPTLLVDGSPAIPELLSHHVDLSLDGVDWIPAGSGRAERFSVSASAMADAPDLFVRLHSTHFQQASDFVVQTVASPLRFATQRFPRRNYMRPGVSPLRGGVSSQDMLDDMRAFAATDAGTFQRLADLYGQIKAWRDLILSNLADAKQAIRQWEHK